MSGTFYNRELSWLLFNDRIVEEALFEGNPLLEKCKFLSIASSNLDEFFMVRVGGLEQSIADKKKKKDIAGLTEEEQLRLIWAKVREQVARQYDVLNRAVLPQLKQEGIVFKKYDQLTRAQQKWLDEHFTEQILPTLTPIAISDRRPFPLLSSKETHIAFLLSSSERRSADSNFAIITLPSKLERCIRLPDENETAFILQEDAVIALAHHFFGKRRPLSAAPFRITRNADFVYNDANANLLILEMQKNLNRRKWGQVVRLEIPSQMDFALYAELNRYLRIPKEKTLMIDGPLNLTYFMKELYKLDGFEHLKYSPFTPGNNSFIDRHATVFDAIKEKDIFLFHPYDSFDPVVRFVQEASEDPNVIAIKQTLYRVSGNSSIVKALSNAARSGKQVSVMIEVRARFDEENNINWCLELEKSGCHVFYGVPHYKTHSKITLIVRREEGKLFRYVHLSTGNYNDSTATQYTDMGLFTCSPILCHDAGLFFNSITGFGRTEGMEKLCSAPDSLRDKLKSLIRQETENAENGLPAGITLKMNSLSDPELIKLLYKAADHGVKVRCVVRGICCLQRKKHPNIHVRSLVGRFLEHARVFIFQNDDDPLVFLSSADWMPRNLDKRVELMFPIEDAGIRDTVIGILEEQLADSVKAWELKKNGTYRRAKPKQPPIHAQQECMKRVENLSD